MGLVNDGYGSFPANVQQTGIEFYDEVEVEVDDNGSTQPSEQMFSYKTYWYDLFDWSQFGGGQITGWGYGIYSQIDSDTTYATAVATGGPVADYNVALSQIMTIIDGLPPNSVDDPFQSDEDLGINPIDLDIMPPIDIIDFDDLKPDNIGGGGGSGGGSGTSPVFDFSAPTGAPFAYLGLGVIFLVVGSYFKGK